MRQSASAGVTALAGVTNPANAGLTGLAAASGTALSPTDAASTANTARAARSRTPTIARTISPIHRLHAENPFIGRSSTPPGPSCTRRVRDITPSPAIRGPDRDSFRGSVWGFGRTTPCLGHQMRGRRGLGGVTRWQRPVSSRACGHRVLGSSRRVGMGWWLSWIIFRVFGRAGVLLWLLLGLLAVPRRSVLRRTWGREQRRVGRRSWV